MSEPATIAPRPTIADILVAHGFVDEEQLAVALETSNHTGQPVGQVLVNAGTITRLELASALAEQWSDPTAAITSPLGSPPTGFVRQGPAEIHSTSLAPPADAAYLARLHDAIADLARRVGAAEPLLAEVERRANETATLELVATLDARLSAVADQLDASALRADTIREAVGTTTGDIEALTQGVEQAVGSLQAGLGELAVRLDTTASLANEAATHDDVAALRGDLAGFSDAFDELRSGVATIGDRVDAADALTAKLDTLERLTAELAARPEAEPELAARLDALAAHVESLAAIAASGDGRLEIDELRDALEELGRRRAADDEGAIATAAVSATVAKIGDRLEAGDAALHALNARIDAVAGRLDVDGETLAEIHALATAATEPVDESLVAGELAALASRVDALAIEQEALGPSRADEDRIETVAEHVASLQTGIADAMAAAVARIETLERTSLEPTTVSAEEKETAWLAATAELSERLDGLGRRLDENVANTAGPAPVAPARAPAPAGETGDETEQELERLRMAIERMGLNLGQQERAIAEVMRSRGVAERLDELEARIDDVAAASSGGEVVASGNGGSPAASNVEVRSLVRRLDSAEAALEAERDKLLTKLERIASALDWRMRRLEADDAPST